MEQTISISVTGKVQGVFYRQTARQKARELSITGTIKNMSDGSVCIIATGSKEQLAELIEWSKQGPPKAMVDRTEVKEEPLQLFDDFRIIR